MAEAETAAVSQHEPLNPSKLGTKAYWDAVYEREVGNYEDDSEDEGTIWFDESNAEEIVCSQLDKLKHLGLLSRGSFNEPSRCASSGSRFLDLGTGNGHMLFKLCGDEDDDNQYWAGEMIGVDYSQASIQLARSIAAQKPFTDRQSLQFEHWDILKSAPGAWKKSGFDVVLDKGTFDAISLMPHIAHTQHPCQVYRHKVLPLIKPGRFLLVTSCNWTKDELISWLAQADGELAVHSEAKYPTFTFGGKTGQSIVTIVFQRRGG